MKLVFSLTLLALFSLTSSLEIECTFRHSQSKDDFYWDVLKHVYTCDGKISEERTKIVTNVERDHLKHKSDNHVLGLLIVHQRELDSFPRGIEKYFDNLRGIDLEGCGLTSISSDDLKPFTELQQLSLDENKIVDLPHDLFKYNLKLVRLDLEGNPILHVGPNIFRPLPELQTVYMRHTSCTTENTMILSRLDLKSLEFELMLECPATFDMTVEALVASEEFRGKLNEIVEKKIREMI